MQLIKTLHWSRGIHEWDFNHPLDRLLETSVEQYYEPDPERESSKLRLDIEIKYKLLEFFRILRNDESSILYSPTFVLLPWNMLGE